MLIPRIFGAELTSNIYLDVGRAFTSNFISCESGEGAPTPLHRSTPLRMVEDVCRSHENHSIKNIKNESVHRVKNRKEKKKL